MPVCKDPSLTFLNQFGYNVIKLPRVGIEPLHVIGRDDTTQLLGPLSAVWKSTLPVPTPSAPRPAANVNGQKTDKIELKFGLKILENALKAFGASSPSLGPAFHKVRSVSFDYVNVTSTSVEPFEAGNYLAAGDLNTENPVVAHYFSDDAEAFLIVEVLKSDTVTVTATDEHGADVTLDVPAIQAAVGANLSVAPSGSSTGTLTFKGSVAVTFGFAALEIDRVDNKWQVAGATPSGALAFSTPAGGATAEAAPVPIVLRPGAMIRL
jgi:hypothetical protein